LVNVCTAALRRALPGAAPVVLGALALGVAGASATEAGKPPLLGNYVGRFSGQPATFRTVFMKVYSPVVFSSISGDLPAVCVRDGLTQRGSLFFQTASRSTRYRGNRKIAADGTFAFVLKKTPDGGDPASYTVSVSGSFAGSVVRGHARGSGSDAAFDKCRGDSAFVARL
jgi:hypothetical protein